MMKKIFYFLVIVFCLGLVRTAKADSNVVNAECTTASKSCFCIFAGGCEDYTSVTNATDLATTQKQCFEIKNSIYKKLYDGKCGTFTGHCNCKPACISYPYTSGDQLEAARLNCKAGTCGASDTTFFAGPCPDAKPAPAGDGVKSISLDNPLALSTDIKTIIANVITKVLQIMGGLSLMMILYGSTGWIQSGGNPEKIEGGKKTITWAVLGVLLTLISYIILKAIFTYF